MGNYKTGVGIDLSCFFILIYIVGRCKFGGLLNSCISAIGVVFVYYIHVQYDR